jgi:hypothetical protein
MATPPGQSAILSGGYSPWQAPLAALFSGISAAGQPGGWSNFGQGVTQGQQNFQQGQQNQQMMELRQQQMAQAEEEMRRANQEREQQEALITSLRTLGGTPGSQPVGGPGGIQTASGTPTAAMFGGDPQLAAIYNGMLDARDVQGALGLATDFATREPEGPQSSLAKLKADLDAGLIDRATYDAMVKKETYIKPEPGSGSFEVDINGDGVPEFTMGGGGISKEWQSKDNAFANRLDNAIIDMDTAEAGGYDPTAATASGVADYVGQRSIGGLVGNALTSEKGKAWHRAAKETLAVILRKDTGAAVTDQEFELYGPIYIPMPWDDPTTKAAKKRAMLTMRNSLRQGIGQTPTAPQESPLAPLPAPPPPAAAPTSADPLGLRTQ